MVGDYVSVEVLESKLRQNYWAFRGSNLPVALHAWPKNGKPGFCGIGQVDWAGKTDPAPIGDVYVGERSEHYHEINRMLKVACQNLGLKFLSMA